MENISSQPTLPTIQNPKPIKLPKKIGPYKIESLYKKGGMSYLYLALHAETLKPLIIKVLLPKFIENKEMVSRFLKEAEIIGLSNHPNIIKLYGQGEWEEGLYIAMEFIQGVSLKQFISEKSLSLRKALEIILQVGYALFHLHSHGIIHRDLKPENILITESGDIKVIDFGIAQLNNETEERITVKRRFMGTPTYMSPEQKIDPKSVNFSSDIFSLGIIAYELIIGKLSHGIINLSLIPKHFRKILEKTLKIDPKDRYEKVVDLITDISEYLKKEDEKEDEQGEGLDIVYDAIKKREDSLIKTSYNFKNLSISVFKEDLINLNSVYLDFFSITENVLAVVFFKTVEKDIDSFLSLLNFQGFVKMLFKTKKITTSSELLNLLNTFIEKESFKGMISNVTFIDLEKDEVRYSCAKENFTYLYEDATNKLIKLTTDDIELLKDKNFTYIEESQNFNVKDKLLLFSKKIKDENLFKDIFFKNALSPPNEILKAFLNNNLYENENNLFISFCIERKY